MWELVRAEIEGRERLRLLLQARHDVGRRRERQRHPEGGPAAGGVEDGDLPAECVDDRRDDRQAEAGAAGLTSA